MPRSLNLDFSDVESRDALPPGEYIVKVAQVEQRDGDKGPYLNWTLEVDVGQFKGRKIWNVTSLSPKSLWVLKKFLEALGVKVTDKMNLDPNSLIGLKCGVKVEQKEYGGKVRAKVIDVFSMNEGSQVGDEPDEDEPEE